MLNIVLFGAAVLMNTIFSSLEPKTQVSYCHRLFCPFLGPKRGQTLCLNKSESTSPKHVSYRVWLKLAHWFLRRSRLKKTPTTGGFWWQ